MTETLKIAFPDSAKARAIMYLLFIVLFTIVLLPFVGGPISWDELLYMDLSAHPKPAAFVMFRFGHVYLQKVFTVFTPGIMQAAKLFWLFLVGSTLFQVFTISYRLSNKNLFCAGIAVYFLFIQKLVFQKYLGVTYPDFTVMFFTVTMLNMYLSTWKDQAFKLFALAVVFMLGFKSKETMLPSAILLAAELYQHFKNKNLIKHVLAVAAGIISVIVLFMGLDAIFLHDAFFGLKPANFKERAQVDLLKTVFTRTSDDVFTFLLRSSVAIPMIFYIWNSGSLKDKSFSQSVAYALPVFCVGFIVLTMITGQWNIEDRYFLPAIPLFCIFGSQFFSGLSVTRIFKMDGLVAKIFFFVTLLVLSELVLKALEIFSHKFSWSTFTFHFGIMLPLVMSGLLVLVIFRETLSRNFFFGGVLFLALLYTVWDLNTNLIMLRNKDSIKTSEKRFAPFRNFKAKLADKAYKKIFISSVIYKYTATLGRDGSSMINMYNAFYDQNASGKNIVVDSIPGQSVLEQPDLIMLHQREIGSLDSMSLTAYQPFIKDSIVLYIKKH